jgi:membrane-bound lytic murein transglycosylase B
MLLIVVAANGALPAGSIAPTAPAVVPAPAPAQNADLRFTTFIRDFRAEAIRAGIRPEIYDASMAGIARNPQVEELNLQQPEFVKPVWQYLDAVVSPERVSKGRQMLLSYGSLLANFEARFGVSKEILVAIWGAETAYGAQMGSFNLFEALATLAYDGPRKDFARRELIAAMKMEQQEHLSPRQMISSWAGAFGQTQFVPSSFLAHAVDGDGDGRRDLWNSPADALASAAVLIRDGGWRRGEPCFYEASLPHDFPYELADLDSTKTFSEWAKLGVRYARGAPLPASTASAAMYLPAGWRGPVFLVFNNFRAILTYNNAATYALAVCDLADRFRGGGEIVARWPLDQQALGSSDRIALQSDLKKLGYDPGNADGIVGRQSRAALRRYQKDRRLPADGFPSLEMLGRLNAEIRERGL